MPKLVLVPQDAASLKALADQLMEVGQMLSASAETMRDCGIEVLQITNYDQLRRGVEFIDNFAAATRSALRKEREARGHFKASNGPRAGQERKK